MTPVPGAGSASLRINRLEEWPDAAGAGPVVRRAARRALATRRPPPSGEISLTLVSEAEIRELNREWLGRDRPTDVIAFPLGDPDRLVGDVYIGVPVAARAAADHGIPLAEELARLAVHGVLHLLGHDHPEGEGREDSDMFRLQERVLGEALAAEREDRGGRAIGAGRRAPGPEERASGEEA